MIYIDSSSKLFHLQSDNTSYILRILPGGHPGHVYFGRKLKNRESFENLGEIPDIAFGTSTAYNSDNYGFSLHHTALEYGSYGKGDYRNPPLMLTGDDGNRTYDFRYDRFISSEAKDPLEGLPSALVEEGEKVETLVLICTDHAQPGLELHLRYSLFPEKDIITRDVRLCNNSSESLQIDKIASFSLDFDNSAYDLISLDGAWIRERHTHRRPLTEGLSTFESRRGISGADHSPFIALCEQSATELRGDAFGFSLVYSGNHSSSVEVSGHGFSRVMMGINDFDFSWFLEPGSTFQTPEAVLVYSSEGLSGMSRLFHRFIRHNIVRGPWKFRERPVLINNWEATYFDFNEKKLLALAREAKTLGIELFVLDDGWFGKRNDDRSSLGDWQVNLKKLPGGIKGLAKKIGKIGLDFGIWVEPEMVSMESELYKEHPEWLVRTPHREPSPGRFQFILDLTNNKVVDYLYESMSDLFSSADISYVKWDMNRHFSDIYSPLLPSGKQKEFSHRYILGLYLLLKRLTERFPEILFESCASGGSRFDMGMFCYMPQIWTSDDTDAVERVKIQQGSSLFAPPSVLGAHVSAVPNHQVLRTTPIESRFNTAAFGLLGYELDLTKLTNFEKKVIKKQILFYKSNRQLLQFGEFYRLKNREDGEISMWMVVSEDRSNAMVGYYQRCASPNPGPERYKLTGLDETREYQVENRTQYMDIRQFGDMINMILPVDLKIDGIVHKNLADNYMYKTDSIKFSASGDQLMYRGIVPLQQFYGTGLDDKIAFLGDFGSRLFVLKEMDS